MSSPRRPIYSLADMERVVWNRRSRRHKGGSIMPISVVTTRKGGTGEAMMAATRKLKVALEKHGAESVVLNQVMAGPDSGQWVVRIMCANWEAFGKVMQAASNDPAVSESIAGLDAVSEMISRRLLASLDL